jgi:hypothetical protein
MYNIIESKYRYIFLICIIGVLLFLFINSGSVVEGLSKKQKKAQAAKATAAAAAEAPEATAATAAATAGATAAATATDTSTELEQQITNSALLVPSATGPSATGAKGKGTKKSRTTEIVKSEVKAQLPSLVSGILATPVADIKDTQTKILAELKQVSTMRRNLKKKMNAVNTNIKKETEENIKKIENSYNTFSSNLSQQYDMYKTGINTEGSNAITSIQDMNKNVATASDQAIAARDKAKEYADLSNKIYNDVFGALTTQVLEQDIAESSQQGFTSMDATGYIRPDSSNKNLFDLEKELVLKINQFNNTYYNFVRCSSGGSVNCDTGNRKTEQNVKDDADAVIASAANLKKAYEDAGISTNDATFKSNHQEIMNKSKSIDELRRNLDNKMDFILKNRNPPNELTQQYDSTVYTGIMWSVLATSVLFYVFTEL